MGSKELAFVYFKKDSDCLVKASRYRHAFNDGSDRDIQYLWSFQVVKGTTQYRLPGRMSKTSPCHLLDIWNATSDSKTTQLWSDL